MSKSVPDEPGWSTSATRPVLLDPDATLDPDGGRVDGC